VIDLHPVTNMMREEEDHRIFLKIIYQIILKKKNPDRNQICEIQENYRICTNIEPTKIWYSKQSIFNEKESLVSIGK
jgi:hypothetical protein